MIGKFHAPLNFSTTVVFSEGGKLFYRNILSQKVVFSHLGGVDSEDLNSTSLVWKTDFHVQLASNSKTLGERFFIKMKHTSRRPGLRRASSMSSFLFVIPIMRMLLSWSTPSILDKSWFTTVSPTPEKYHSVWTIILNGM